MHYVTRLARRLLTTQRSPPCGPRPSTCWTCGAKLFMPRRMSVCPARQPYPHAGWDGDYRLSSTAKTRRSAARRPSPEASGCRAGVANDIPALARPSGRPGSVRSGCRRRHRHALLTASDSSRDTAENRNSIAQYIGVEQVVRGAVGNIALIETEPLGQDPNEVPPIACARQVDPEIPGVDRGRRLSPSHVLHI
jgi:hypothetical protein